jgi:hypothetical protein
MELYRLYYKHTDPDTGDITHVKDIGIINCDENNIKLLHHCIGQCNEDPNNDYYYEEINTEFKMTNKKTIELLNSEGPILTATKTDHGYEIRDQYKNDIAVLSESEIQRFVHGNLVMSNSKGELFNYSTYPGSMKPNLKELDEFIGIVTEGKTY